MSRAPRRAYRVVDDFEQELADYCGSPFAIAVNSATNALLLSLTWERLRGLKGLVSIPRHTYVGVAQSVLNADFGVEWQREPNYWQEYGFYSLDPSNVWDFARCLKRGMFDGLPVNSLACLSLHVAKQLPVGRGGAILTDNEAAAEWLLAARMDGRPPGAPIEETITPAYHCPMPPDVAARGLDILSRWNDAGYSPPPLPPTDYPDLSLLDFSKSHQRASSQSAPNSPVVTNFSPWMELR